MKTLLSIVALCAFCLSGIIIGAVLSGQSPSLPYTEPQHEFKSKDGRDCVAWDFQAVQSHVIICEGLPPMLVTPKPKTI